MTDQQPQSPPADQPAVLPVVANGLVKRYGRRVAVDGLSLSVGRGEVVGLLGPNGAGKTTTVKMLLGLVRPSEGSAALFGAPSSRPEARRRVGYLPEQFRFQPWLTGRELLEFHVRLAGVERDARPGQIAAALDLVGLATRGDERIAGYSKGMQQRIGLAQALIGDPELVILDEPTSALDPIGRRDVREIVRQLRARGTAVVLNSHLLSEVEMICDRVVIVDQGRVIRSGRLDELAGTGLELRVRLDHIDARALDLLGGHGEVVAHQDGEVLLELDDPDAVADVASELVTAGYGLLALVPLQRSLEDVFVNLVGSTEGE